MSANLNVENLQGKMYPQGDSGTITIGTVKTGAEGTAVKVTNTGTRSNAILNFEIPVGNTGETGDGIEDIQKTATAGLVDTYTIFCTSGKQYNFTVTNADVGSAYTKTQTDKLLENKIDKSAIVNEITGSVVFGDDEKLASLAAIKGLKNLLGDLSNLTTTEKTSIVLAINELVTSIGVLSNLTTTQKANIVLAINELVTELGNKQTAINNLNKTKQNSIFYTATVTDNKFTINSENTLATGNTYKVKFPTSANTNTAQLSVDNGKTYHDINGCTAQALSDEYLTVVFTGTYFEALTDLGTATIEYVADISMKIFNIINKLKSDNVIYKNKTVKDELDAINGAIIVESGANANGSYIKYADGTMICRGRKTFSASINNAWGSLYTYDYKATINFPQKFDSSSDVDLTVSVVNSGSACTITSIDHNYEAITKVAVARGNSYANASVRIEYIAIGRWKE